MSNVKKSGFVAVLGRPNAGKSTLLNYLVESKLAMVSHKANATRKRMNIIVPHKDAQIIFVDTPGLHRNEKLLNKYMLNEALKAMSDCDISIFLAPASDELHHYLDFLETSKGKKHILVLTKSDTVSHNKLLEKIEEYSAYKDKFSSLVPFSISIKNAKEELLNAIYKELEASPALYDEDIMTTSHLREIYKELIRESLFENTSDEVPYESDVIINKVEEGDTMDKIKATIIAEKNSQKIVLIGKGGATIKRIGRDARLKIESMSGKKLFLDLNVKVLKGWSKEKDKLADIGYDFLE